MGRPVLVPIKLSWLTATSSSVCLCCLQPEWENQPMTTYYYSAETRQNGGSISVKECLPSKPLPFATPFHWPKPCSGHGSSKLGPYEVSQFSSRRWPKDLQEATKTCCLKSEWKKLRVFNQKSECLMGVSECFLRNRNVVEGSCCVQKGPSVSDREGYSATETSQNRNKTRRWGKHEEREYGFSYGTYIF